MASAAALLGLALAWAYSAPPLRLKRNGWWGTPPAAPATRGCSWVTGAAVMTGGPAGRARSSPRGPLQFRRPWHHGAQRFQGGGGRQQIGICRCRSNRGGGAAWFACLMMGGAADGVVATLADFLGQPYMPAPWGCRCSPSSLSPMRRLWREPRKARAPWYNATGTSSMCWGCSSAASPSALNGGRAMIKTPPSAGSASPAGPRQGGARRVGRPGDLDDETGDGGRRRCPPRCRVPAWRWHYGSRSPAPLGLWLRTWARRTPWIIGGMGALALGSILATDATVMIAHSPVLGSLLALVAFSMVGAGVSTTALRSWRSWPPASPTERRPAAAWITWIMMIFGIVLAASISGALLQPFSPQRLAMVASGLAGVCFLMTLFAVWKAEDAPETVDQAGPVESARRPSFGQVIAEIRTDPLARRFTIFVFVSMLAYSAQELILKKHFAGLVFNMNPGQSAQLSGAERRGRASRNDRGGRFWLPFWRP